MPLDRRQALIVDNMRERALVASDTQIDRQMDTSCQLTAITPLRMC